MITAKIASKKDVDTLIYDDELYDRMTQDNAPPKEEIKIPYNAAKYIGGYVNKQIASLFIVHNSKMHFMVLKKFRKFARELLKESFTLQKNSVYIIVPALYMSVINFAKKYGFKEVSVEKNAHLKRGKLYDNHKLIYEV